MAKKSDAERLDELRAKDVLNMSELGEKVELETATLKAEIDGGRTWGNWKYEADAPPCVSHRVERYEITLDRIDTDAKLGDWLLHLVEKGWVTAADLGNLVVAVTDLQSVGYHSINRRCDA